MLAQVSAKWLGFEYSSIGEEAACLTDLMGKAVFIAPNTANLCCRGLNVFGRDYLPFIIPIKSIKNAASSPIELYSKPSHFADLCPDARRRLLACRGTPAEGAGMCQDGLNWPSLLWEARRVSPRTHPTSSRPRPKAWVCPVARGASPPSMGQ